jgi:hypothetical protein
MIRKISCYFGFRNVDSGKMLSLGNVLKTVPEQLEIFDSLAWHSIHDMKLVSNVSDFDRLDSFLIVNNSDRSLRHINEINK